jgi:hypothetical protein
MAAKRGSLRRDSGRHVLARPPLLDARRQVAFHGQVLAPSIGLKQAKPESHDKTISSRLQQGQFRLEFEAQLGTFILTQPERHLREDCAIERNARRLPRSPAFTCC